MPETILLQAAIAAAYFLEIALIIILIIGVAGFWIYFTKIDLKKQKEKPLLVCTLFDY